MKRFKLNSNTTKGICALLAAAVAVTSVSYVSSREEIVSQANAITLPGVEEIRDEILTSGETYQILEIVPDSSDAEIGWLIGGEEPLPCLWDASTNTYQSWEDKIAGIADDSERQTFMNTTLSDEYNNASTSNAELGLDYKAYAEYDNEDDAKKAVSDGNCSSYSSLTVAAKISRGYFIAVGNGTISSETTGKYNPVFTPTVTDLSDKNINEGTSTPYYEAHPITAITDGDTTLTLENGSLTYGQLVQLFSPGTPTVGDRISLSSNKSFDEMTVYTLRDDGYYISESKSEEKKTFTLADVVTDFKYETVYVSGGDLEDSENTVTYWVSDGDLSVDITNEATGYYAVYFELLGQFDTNDDNVYEIDNPWVSGTPLVRPPE